MKIIIISITIILQLLVQCYGANILMLFTIPSLSQHLMYRPLIYALAERNHTIVLVTTDPVPEQERKRNIYEIDVHDVSYAVWKKHMAAYARDVSANREFVFLTVIWPQLCKDIGDQQLNSTAMQRFLKDGPHKFDLVLGSIMHLANLAFSKLFDAPFIGLQPTNLVCEMHRLIGNSFHHDYYPDPYIAPTGSLLKDFYDMHIFHNAIQTIYEESEQNVKKHLAIDINLTTKMEDIDFVVLPANFQFSVVRPIRPNTHFVGDVRTYEEKPLENDLQKFLDESSAGVVYISLGTNILSSNLSKQRLKIFIVAMKNIPYRVLWKFESKNLPELSPNVLTAQWFQQRDVLAHPNVKVFVTHGGLLSIGEALYHEVPVVVIPFFGDQHFNAMRVKNLGVGDVLDYTNMTSTDLENAIRNVGTNKSYTDSMEVVSDRLFDQRVSSVETAVWWVEYIIRHRGGSHFQHPRISTTEYLMLDVIGAVVFFLISAIFGLYKLVGILIILFFHKSRVYGSRFCFAPQN